MPASTYDETQHARDGGGKYAAKQTSPSEVALAATGPEFLPRRLSDEQAMDQVARLLSGNQDWSPDTLSQLHEVVGATGRPMCPPDTNNLEDNDAYLRAYEEHLATWRATQRPDVTTRAGLNQVYEQAREQWASADRRMNEAIAKIVASTIREHYGSQATHLELDCSDQGDFMDAARLRDADGHEMVGALDAIAESGDQGEDDIAMVTNFETAGDGCPKGHWAQWCDRGEHGDYRLSLAKVDQIDMEEGQS